MAKIIINRHDGTVTDLEGAFILDLEKLDNPTRMLWAEWLDTGSDEVACKIATLGESLKAILEGCGFGDLDYGNAYAYSALSLRDEIDAFADGGYDYEWLDKAKKLTNEQLDYLGRELMSNDYLWSVWRNELIDALSHYDYPEASIPTTEGDK